MSKRGDPPTLLINLQLLPAGRLLDNLLRILKGGSRSSLRRLLGFILFLVERISFIRLPGSLMFIGRQGIPCRGPFMGIRIPF